MNSTNLPPESRESVSDHLNELIALCNDSQSGFRAAADHTKSPELRALFIRLSRQRIDFAEDLRVAVANLVHDINSSLNHRVNREWTSMKTTFVSDDPQSALIECERSEQAAVKAYQNVLRNVPLENACRILVTAQASSVQTSHNHLCTLRNHPAYAK